MKRIAAVMLLLGSAVAGGQERERLPIEQLRKFAEVYGAIRANYIDATDHEVLVRHAIEGLLKIDPQGQFLDAEEFSALQRGPDSPAWAAWGWRSRCDEARCAWYRQWTTARHRAPG